MVQALFVPRSGNFGARSMVAWDKLVPGVLGMFFRSPFVLVTLVLVAAPFASLLVPNASAATTSRVLAITNGSAHPQVAFQAFDGNPPKFFDINNDGKQEIIAQNDNQWVYVFDSTTGAILAQMRTTLPSGWGARSFNGPEVTIVANGGPPKLIVQNSAAYVTSFRFDQAGHLSTQFHFFEEMALRFDHYF